jgi:hypothetical protein
MPHFGPVPSPGAFDHVPPPPPGDAGLPPTHGFGAQQIHRAAGGPDRWYIDLEHIVWYPKSGPVAFPLVTASPPASAGLLGAEGTRVLFGNENIDYGYFNVFRLTGGLWDLDRRWGLEASGFIQEAKGEYANFLQPVSQIVAVGGRQALARPAIDVFTGLPTSLIVGFPGVSTGEIFIESRLKMGGAEGNLLRSLMYCDRFKFNLLAGVRYIDLDENLAITSRSSDFSIDPVNPAVRDVFDEFATRNEFFGGQVGFQSELRRGRYFADVIGKIGIGNMKQELVVRGFTNTLDVGGFGTTLPGGLLALASNITRTTRDEFAIAPELTVKLGYQWTQRISGYIGYNVLYLNRVLRPGDQIDPVINPVFLPSSVHFGGEFGPIRPANTFNETDFWTQGVTFGLAIRY